MLASTLSPSRRTLLRLAGLVALLAVATVYLADPEGVGGLAFFASVALALISLAVGPLVHRPTNKGPWRWLAAAGFLFLGSLILRLGVLQVPAPLGNADLWAFGGYACTVPFLFGLLRRTTAGWDPTLWLDTAAMTTGSALIGWVMNVAPQLSSPDLQMGQLLVNAMYPVMDAMLLILTIQLAFRRGSEAPALQAAVAGLSALLIGDLAYTFLWISHPGAVNPYLNLCYLVAYACMALMATHPSMRELSDEDALHPPTTSRGRLVLIFVTLLIPASIPIVVPTHGQFDGLIRAVIMTVLGCLVFLRLLGTVRDLRVAQAQAQYRATHDGLTGLPNRTALLESLDKHLNRVRDDAGGGWVNIFFIDCDHFKNVNDSWGHAAGDEVLVELARRLRGISRDCDDLSRVGGDEFVLRIDTSRADSAAQIAQRIMAVFDVPLDISGNRSTRLTPSIGIAQVEHSAQVSAVDMIRNADLALYQAKNAGRAGFATYDTSMHEQVARRHDLADALRDALSRSEISVVYQPIRSGPNYGDLSGWEALARWNHPELGSVSPLEFVPIAEDTGLIGDIGAFVLREAAHQVKDWQEMFAHPGLHVSVNVSSVQLLRDDVVELTSDVLRETGLTPESLWLEITESVLLARTDDALESLNALGRLGVKLCLDDFGTGYSSLSYLKDFPLHILKVDRAFIRNIVEDQRDRNLTKAMIDLAAALELDGVVAEGVEDVEQAELLAAIGCSMVQGYFFGRPVPPVEATAAAAAVLGPGSAAPSPVSTGAVPQPRPAKPAVRR